MLSMSNESRAFLRANCSAALEAGTLKDALRILYEDIEEKGFGGPRSEEYNDYGRVAQKVYDDLYLSNRRNSNQT